MRLIEHVIPTQDAVGHHSTEDCVCKPYVDEELRGVFHQWMTSAPVPFVDWRAAYPQMKTLSVMDLHKVEGGWAWIFDSSENGARRWQIPFQGVFLEAEEREK